jgi:hypothetical protein
MKDKRSLHLKVQELCDCYATTDPLKEMSELKKEEDKDDAALKWLALATLHGINSHAKKITVTRSEEGDVNVTAEYRAAELPSPGSQIGNRIIKTVREITHVNEDKGKTPLALGIRDGNIEIIVKVKKGKEIDSIALKFPE